MWLCLWIYAQKVCCTFTPTTATRGWFIRTFIWMLDGHDACFVCILIDYPLHSCITSAFWFRHLHGRHVTCRPPAHSHISLIKSHLHTPSPVSTYVTIGTIDLSMIITVWQWEQWRHNKASSLTADSSSPRLTFTMDCPIVGMISKGDQHGRLRQCSERPSGQSLIDLSRAACRSRSA